MAELRRAELVLASASPFRRRMLEAAGLSFRVVPADVDEAAIRQRLARKTPFALLYADLDNFKAFNDIYGFSRGNLAIQFVASIIQRVMAAHGNPDDTIGHIGGDDFAILTTPNRAEPICRVPIK